RGYVREVHTAGGWTDFEMTTSAGEFSIRVPADRELERFNGAFIRARGVCAALTNERRQLTGVRLWAGDASDFDIEEAAAEDPFLAPLRAIDSLRRFSAVRTFNRRVRVSGVVTHHLPGRFLVVQEGRDSLFALSRDETPLTVGDRVDVVGLPGR